MVSLNERGNSIKPLHCNGNSGVRKLPPIVGQEGFSFSRQASAGHYCYPQKLCSFELYSEFEIMCLSDLSDSDFIGDNQDIYVFVPRSL